MNSLTLERISTTPNILSFEISDKLYLLTNDLLIDGTKILNEPLEILGLEQGIVLIYENGTILSLYDGILNEIGVIENGIICCSSSQDQEIITVLNKRGKLLILNKEFNIINEFLIEIDTIESKLNSITLNEKRASISWRGDSEYFCLAFDKKLRVYTKDGELTSTAPIEQNSVCWKPEGTLIATIKGQDVQFYEKNGLEHGNFGYRHKGGISNLCWSNDSLILCTMTADSKQIMLWYTSNYHYYLKYTLESKSGFKKMKFDLEDPLVLHTTSNDLVYARYEFKMETLRSKGMSGSVAVIDGKTVLLTPFSRANVPPPMSLYQIEMEKQVLNVCFGFAKIGNNSEEEIIVVLCESNVEFHTIGSQPLKIGELQIEYQNPRQIALVSNTLVILHHSNNSRVAVLELDISANGIYLKNDYKVNHDHDLEVQSLVCDSKTSTIALQTCHGQIYELSLAEYYVPTFTTSFPRKCTWTDVANFKDGKGFIGLTSKNKLYLDEKLLLPDCSSFLVHEEFLIATTLKHICRFANLKMSKYDFNFSDKESTTFDEQQRRIEQGAKIVVAAQNSMNLVLEMPRGNLETISPRALVLSQIRKLISDSKFIEAFKICRRHRIDLNILVDYNWELFEQQIDQFCSEISEEYLCLLVAGIKNENVCATIYKEPMVEVVNNVGDDKVNRICILLRKAIQKSLNPSRQAILCTFAKEDPPQLSAALLNIAQVAKNDTKEAETLLKYLIFLADVESLYTTALSIYNFDLCLMVAQFSQKDPREYLPFLSMLKSFEPSFQKFYINDYLKFHDLALKFLVEACDAEEHYATDSGQGECIQFCDVISYIKKHELYTEATKIYTKSRKEYPNVLSCYAEFISEKRDYGQSAMCSKY